MIAQSTKFIVKSQLSNSSPKLINWEIIKDVSHSLIVLKAIRYLTLICIGKKFRLNNRMTTTMIIEWSQKISKWSTIITISKTKNLIIVMRPSMFWNKLQIRWQKGKEILQDCHFSENKDKISLENLYFRILTTAKSQISTLTIIRKTLRVQQSQSIVWLSTIISLKRVITNWEINTLNDIC